MGALTGANLPPRVASAARDVADALRFFTRLPLPAASAGPLDFNRFAWAAPVAGGIIGLIGSVALAFAELLGLPPLLGASLATAAMVGATGGLHEDGLADVADGFGGGATRARKLEIMRDSRIGAFGATALMLALLLRVGALAFALSHGFWSAAGALVVVAALSRAGALIPLALLDPARVDGAGAAAGRLELQALGAAWAVALVVAVVISVAGFGLGRAITAAIACAIGAAAMTALARRQIGGQTGDVGGAAQQWAEIAGWCGLLTGGSAP